MPGLQGEQRRHSDICRDDAGGNGQHLGVELELAGSSRKQSTLNAGCEAEGREREIGGGVSQTGASGNVGRGDCVQGGEWEGGRNVGRGVGVEGERCAHGEKKQEWQDRMEQMMKVRLIS